MKRFLKIKNTVVLAVTILISSSTSLLFAAETNVPPNANAQTTQELQQIQALQQPLPAAQSSTQAPPGVTFGQAITQNAPGASSTTSAGNGGLNLPPPTGAENAASAPPPSVTPPVQPNTASDSSAPPSSGAVSVQDVSNQAFNAMTQSMLPMTPEQIQRLRQLFDQSQSAAAALPTTPARPVISSQMVSLAPGSTPPVIRMQVGMVSILTFLDSTGAPWPIQAYDVGNPNAFNIQWNKSDNTMMIQPLTSYAYGNLAIVLQGLSTPVTLSLTTGQRAFDARVDLHVQGMGPNAQAPVGSGLPGGVDPTLMGVLDGVPPSGATALKVSGGIAQVWLSGAQMYVRTRYTVLSPAWISTMSSADGMNAYLMPKSPSILASQNGKVIQLNVDGF